MSQRRNNYTVEQIAELAHVFGGRTRKNYPGAALPVQTGVIAAVSGKTAVPYVIHTIDMHSDQILKWMIEHQATMQAFATRGHIQKLSEHWLLTHQAQPNDLFIAVHHAKTSRLLGVACCTVRPQTIFVELVSSITRGIGSVLMRHIEREAVRRGKSYIELVTVTNKPAVRFYAKHGFKRGPPLGTEENNSRALKAYRQTAKFTTDFLYAPEHIFMTKYKPDALQKVATKFFHNENKFREYFSSPKDFLHFLTKMHDKSSSAVNVAVRKRLFLNHNELKSHLPKIHKNIRDVNPLKRKRIQTKNNGVVAQKRQKM